MDPRHVDIPNIIITTTSGNEINDEGNTNYQGSEIGSEEETSALLSSSTSSPDNEEDQQNSPVLSSENSNMKFSSPVIKGRLRQAYATFIVNLGVLGLGTVIGWSSPGIASIEKTKKLDSTEKSLIGSIVNLGALGACLLGAYTIDKLGRKNSMLLFTIPFIIGWIVMIFAKEEQVGMIYAGRFISGFAAGFYGVSGPVFVGEIADEKIRGFLSNAYGIFLTLGFLISYLFGTFLTWNHLSILCCAIPVILLILLFTIPESPRYYVQIGQQEKAMKSLCWYRSTKVEADVTTELSEIKKNIEELQANSKANSLADLIAPGALKPFILSVALVFFEQFSGFPAIVAFTSQIIATSKINLEPNIATIIFGIAQFLATILSSLLIDKAGRRSLLIWSQAVNVFALGAIGLYFQFSDEMEGLSWIPLVGLILYIISFSIGIGPISTTLMGELLPQNIRGVGSAICTAILRIIAFSVSFGFEEVSDLIGISWCFNIFAIICILGVLFTIFLVPETKGKTLEEIRKLFISQV